MIIVSKISICDTCDTLQYTKKFNAMLLRISTYFWYKAWQEQLYCKFSKFCIFCFFRDSNSLLIFILQDLQFIGSVHDSKFFQWNDRASKFSFLWNMQASKLTPPLSLSKRREKSMAKKFNHYTSHITKSCHDIKKIQEGHDSFDKSF